MVFLRFRAKTGNHVRGKAAVRHNAADFGHALQVPLPVVLAAHQFQHPGTAALYRQVDVVADIGMSGHGFNDLVADILGVGRGKTHAKVRRHGCHALEQAGKIHGFRLALPQVAVHVLSQQRNFLIPFLIHVAGFPDNGVGIPRAFRAAGIGHHAVRAHIVAPAHNGNKGRYAVFVCAHRRNVRVGLLPGEENINLRAVRRDGLQQAGEGTVGVRAHHQIYLPGVQQFVFQAFCHAAHNAHQGAGTGFALLVENLQAAPDALLRVVADGAGVGHNEVGFLHALRAGVAGFLQDGKNDFGVIHVHLTPVCFNIGFLHRFPP